jgi:hypothetical protein
MLTRLRALLMFVVLVLGAAAASRAEAQTPAALQAQLNKLAAAQRTMDSTIKRLEARIAKLETAAESDDTDAREEAEKAEAEKQAADLERRIAALERAPAAKGGNPSSAAGSTVRAPFVVQDEDGSVIFRVTGGKSARLMIGEEKGGSVEMGTGSAGGGIVRVRDASGTDRAQIIASEGHGQYRAMARTHSAVLIAEDGENGAMLSLFSGETPTARVQSGRQGFGAFILTDPSGTPLVFGGSMSSGGGHVGTIRTGPKARAGTMGPPSILQGAP